MLAPRVGVSGLRGRARAPHQPGGARAGGGACGGSVCRIGGKEGWASARRRRGVAMGCFESKPAPPAQGGADDPAQQSAAAVAPSGTVRPKVDWKSLVANVLDRPHENVKDYVRRVPLAQPHAAARCTAALRCAPAAAVGRAPAPCAVDPGKVS